jgi:uncharacterized membrane protein
MNTRRLPNFTGLLKKHFLAGILVIIPLAVIAWILLAALGWLWTFHELLPEAWQPENFLHHNQALATLVNLVFTLAVAFVVAIGVSFLGWISRQFLGQKLLEFIGEIIQHIPVIRSVYSALDQLLRTIAAGGGQQFSRVVYVEWPRKGIWAIAFVTGPAKGPGAPPNHLNIFVPTTPNPTAGFHMLIPESEVRESQMRVEEAFKTILSLGIAQPEGPIR